MSGRYSFVNQHIQPYETLKQSLELGRNSAIKFDVLNAHVRNIVVMPGEVIIVGDNATPSCTAYEASLMAKAQETHFSLIVNGGVARDFSTLSR